jgi:hypothetical protein
MLQGWTFSCRRVMAKDNANRTCLTARLGIWTLSLGPRRHDAGHPCVRDQLPHVLVRVNDDAELHPVHSRDPGISPVNSRLVGYYRLFHAWSLWIAQVVHKQARRRGTSIILRSWVTGTPPVTHIYIKPIEQPTLHYLTRSVRRRAATSKRRNRTRT